VVREIYFGRVYWSSLGPVTQHQLVNIQHLPIPPLLITHLLEEAIILLPTTTLHHNTILLSITPLVADIQLRLIMSPLLHTQRHSTSHHLAAADIPPLLITHLQPTQLLPTTHLLQVQLIPAHLTLLLHPHIPHLHTTHLEPTQLLQPIPHLPHIIPHPILTQVLEVVTPVQVISPL